MRDGSLAVFAKAPLPGLAKTRLGEQIGMRAAAAQYEEMLLHQLAQAQATSSQLELFLYCAGPKHLHWFQQRFPHLNLKMQQGQDLGQRMHHAFQELFSQGSAKVILIGTDAPDLSTELILQTNDLLDSDEVVLGPAVDGGYYLIGQRSPGWRLFDEINWSTDQVLAQTAARIKERALSFSLLPELRDIDTMEDLEALNPP
ncbi:MAG: TIGR04282 family arsenosugar biosynthesis glycosyltransferase [Anaerolineales bacterium]